MPSVFISKWIPLDEAIEKCIRLGVSKEEAWDSIRQAIIDEELKARGFADGIKKKLHPGWLSILRWDDLVGSILWFRKEKRRGFSPPAPHRIERMEVDGEEFSHILGKAKKAPTLDTIKEPQKRWADKRARNEFIIKEVVRLVEHKGITKEAAIKQIFSDNEKDLKSAGIKKLSGLKRACYR